MIDCLIDRLLNYSITHRGRPYSCKAPLRPEPLHFVCREQVERVVVLSLDLDLDVAEHRSVVLEVEALDMGDLGLEVEVDAKVGLALVHVDSTLVNLEWSAIRSDQIKSN